MVSGSRIFSPSLTGDGTEGTGLFPNISFTGTLKNTQSKLKYPTVTDTSIRTSTSQYELTITQPVFNAATWSSIATSRNTVRSATATYLYSGQSLISRTVSGYLEVLRNYEILQYYLAAEEALKEELDNAQHKLSVGLSAETDVYEAQASYDTARVLVIKQRNTLSNAQEDLRAITGKTYNILKGLPKVIPLVAPKPQSINAWVKIAEKQNYGLLADRFAMYAAHGDVRTKYLSHLPTLNAVGDYNHLNHDEASASGGETPSDKTSYVGLSLSFPVFQGGYLYASTKQARYTYLKASDTVDLQHRTVIKDAREDYRSVTSGISQVQADLVSVESSKKQLMVTHAAYIAGSRTMIDVLDSVSTLFSSLNSWINDRYDYLESLIQLKYDAGTLSPKDITTMNGWLTRRMNVSQDKFSSILGRMVNFNGITPKTLGPDALPQVAKPFDEAQAKALIQSIKTSESKHESSQVVKAKAKAKVKTKVKAKAKAKVKAKVSSLVAKPMTRTVVIVRIPAHHEMPALPQPRG